MKNEKALLRYETEEETYMNEELKKEYIKETTYAVFSDGSREVVCSVDKPKHTGKQLSSKELEQLDRDEIMLDMALSLEEIKLNQELSMMGGGKQ